MIYSPVHNHIIKMHELVKCFIMTRPTVHAQYYVHNILMKTGSITPPKDSNTNINEICTV